MTSRRSRRTPGSARDANLTACSRGSPDRLDADDGGWGRGPRDSGRAFRVLYVAKCREAIYVLHAFEKKSQRTAKRDLELAQARLRDVLDRRRSQR